MDMDIRYEYHLLRKCQLTVRYSTVSASEICITKRSGIPFGRCMTSKQVTLIDHLGWKSANEQVTEEEKA